MNKPFRCTRCLETCAVIHYEGDERLCDSCQGKRLKQQGMASQGRTFIK